MTLPITPDDVVEASRALRGIAVRTPHISVPALNEAAGATVIVKAENMQRTGSFKFRGAYHHAASLPADARQRGIIGASSGNHAQALALAGRLLDAPTMVVIPSDAPRAKVEGAVALGADVVLYDRRFGDRDALVADLAEQHGLTIIPSANSPLVMAGAGTAAMELIADHPEITTLVVPVGGGGLAAGTAVIAKDLRPEIRVVGVEPRSAADTLASLRAGRRVSLAEVPSTVADGLGHTTPPSCPGRSTHCSWTTWSPSPTTTSPPPWATPSSTSSAWPNRPARSRSRPFSPTASTWPGRRSVSWSPAAGWTFACSMI